MVDYDLKRGVVVMMLMMVLMEMIVDMAEVDTDAMLIVATMMLMIWPTW